MKPSPRRMPLRLLAAAWLLPLTSAAAYDVVHSDGTVTRVESLAFSGKSAILGTDTGRVTVDAAGLDYYETFRQNLGSRGGNVIVFATGALLRFESLNIKDGVVGVKVAGGAGFVVPESLVDFQASVREGAMVRLPESAGQYVARSASRDGRFVDEPVPDEPSAETPQSPRASSRVRPGGSRRLASGLRDRRPEAAEEEAGGNGEPEPLTPQGEDLAGQGDQSGGPGNESQQGGQQGGQGEEQDREQVAAGQSVLVVTTSYSGEIGGLQATVTFPPSLRVVEPVTFSGFGAALGMPTVNTRIPGQVQIIAITNPGPESGIRAGGEFLRLTFTWVGRQPTLQQFSVALKITDAATGAEIPDAPRELSLF